MNNRRIIHYNSNLKQRAAYLRKNMTKGEVLLWTKLRRDQMMGYDFHRQKPIGNYIVDFFCPALRLIIEIDGISHLGKEAYDQKRDAYLQSLGFHILHFREADVCRSLESICWIMYSYIEDFEENNKSP